MAKNSFRIIFPETAKHDNKNQNQKMIESKDKRIGLKSLSLSIVLVASLAGSGRMSAQYSEFGIGTGFSTYWGDLNAPALYRPHVVPLWVLTRIPVLRGTC